MASPHTLCCTNDSVANKVALAVLCKIALFLIYFCCSRLVGALEISPHFSCTISLDYIYMCLVRQSVKPCDQVDGSESTTGQAGAE